MPARRATHGTNAPRSQVNRIGRRHRRSIPQMLSCSDNPQTKKAIHAPRHSPTAPRARSCKNRGLICRFEPAAGLRRRRRVWGRPFVARARSPPRRTQFRGLKPARPATRPRWPISAAMQQSRPWSAEMLRELSPNHHAARLHYALTLCIWQSKFARVR